MTAEASIRAALAEYDRLMLRCPVNNPSIRTAFKPSDKCPQCGALASGNCGVDATASYHFVQEVRRALGAKS